MRLTNRHMIKPWVYAIPSEKNANMKAPASSSSTCFSAFSAVVCCWSFCTFLLNDSQYFLGTCFTITLLRVFNSWCPNQNVKHACKVWLCASRTCCWSISFSWRRIGWLCWRSAFCSKDASSHIHTCIQGVVKFCPSCIQVMSTLRGRLWLRNQLHELTKFSAWSAFDTLTHLQFLVLLFSQELFFFKLVCSSLCLMISKTNWRFRGVHVRHTHRHSKPCSWVTQFQSKNDEKRPERTCLLQFNLLPSILSSCLLHKLLCLRTNKWLATSSRNVLFTIRCKINLPAHGFQRMVSESKCQARFQSLAGYVPLELASGAFLSLGEWLADFAGDAPFAQKMRSSHINTCIQGVVKFCPSCIQVASALCGGLSLKIKLY